MGLKENFSYSEESDYEKGESSIKEIVLRHIRKMSDLICQELTSGYFQEKPVKVGDSFTVIKVYHPDLKEAYCNAVDFLVDILYPKSDEKFKTYIDGLTDIDTLKDTAKINARRQIFKQINLFMERTNYFQSGDASDE